MITLAQLRKTAASAGFRPEPLEKVLRLLEILDRLDHHEISTGRWALKGGTALNLFYLDLPRLSVDVDVNFTGVVQVEDLPPARETFERALTACCLRAGCSIRRAPSEHARGKFRLRFSSLLGGTQNLEIDVSYVARVPLLAVGRRRLVSPALAAECEAPCLSLEELAAGKFTALVVRGAARDYFDALSIVRLDPALLDTRDFRLAFVCQVAFSRKDPRTMSVEASKLGPREIERELLPLLRVRPDGVQTNAASLASDFSRELGPALRRLLTWSTQERKFLDRFQDHGEIEPALLTGDPNLQRRIGQQPMLLWKQIHIRSRKR